MMRSLYSGVAGLRTHQTKMDVIGNNIANVNTTAFKAQSITFSELMYQTSAKASAPNETTGTAGTNAKQIGLGVASAAISSAITTQGSSQNTGNAFDLMITGSSFFVVSDGSSNFFTRDGSFYVDSVGNLAMSSTGYNVMGWLPQTDAESGKTTIRQDTVKPLRIMSAENLTASPEATTQATITGILDKNDVNVQGDGKNISLSFYDNLGYSYTAKFTVKATDGEGEYSLALADVLDANNDSILDRFDATIFTGTNEESAAATYSQKSATYTLMAGYTMDATSAKITDKDGNEYDPGDFLNEKGMVDRTNADREKAAIKYAEAFGYDDPDEFFNLTVLTDEEQKSYTRIGDILKSGRTYDKKVYKNPNDPTEGTVDVTPKPDLFSLKNGASVLSVDGYSLPKGTGVSIAYNQATGEFVGINGSNNIQAYKLALAPKKTDSANPFEVITIDMKDSLNYNNNQTSTMAATSGSGNNEGAGCAVGNMTGVSIQNNGMIYGAYDNGKTKLLGQIAVANFSNAMGLERKGDNLYSASMNSGNFDGIGVDVTSDGGYISTGVLEMSNVDLSAQFTDMITTQRGFQANSRIITVSDTLLEELVNLKR